ncbi:MAG: YicC/YloC family endoribonuclease, partial [Pseudomonadota bacterium]
MALNSMTGYASADGALDDDGQRLEWLWDLRSVNGKSLDIRLRLPSLLSDLEPECRKMLSGKLARGNVNVSLSFNVIRKGESLTVNRVMVEELVAASRMLASEHGVEPLTADGLLSMRGVIETAGDGETLSISSEARDRIMESFATAIGRLVDARHQEGSALHATLLRIMEDIERLVTELDNAPERRAERIRERLSDQIADLLAASTEFSADRLHQEALLIAAKVDIQEEIDRLRAHVENARALLESNDPVGRRLDFLSQEFNREANTICSKSNAIALTNLGLELKAAIDQFREQIQNI